MLFMSRKVLMSCVSHLSSLNNSAQLLLYKLLIFHAKDVSLSVQQRE